MQTVRARLAATPLNAADQTPIGDRLDHLANAIDAGPKSLAWRTRSAVGERVRWYDEPDEVGEAAQR
jgi:hypothetical protein